MNSITFWQNVPSIHQAPMIRELARLVAPTPVSVVTDEPLSQERAKQGWSEPYFGLAQLLVRPPTAERSHIAKSRSTPQDMHIFSGFNAYPGVDSALRLVCQSNARVFIFAEPGRTDDGIRAVLRHFRYRAHAARFGRRIDAILATGETDYQFYKGTGFPEDRIKRFAYFTEAPAVPDHADRNPKERPLGIAFVGGHVRWKRIDLLIRALDHLRYLDWHLTLVGSGPLTGKLRKSTASWEPDRASWLGGLPNSAVQELMLRHDLLVLPSEYDGWGAVTNEALLMGTPVVTSNACGSSDLLVNSQIGDVFESRNYVSLREVLRKRITAGPVKPDDREARAKWAIKAISPSAGAHYLLALLEGQSDAVRPWRVALGKW